MKIGIVGASGRLGRLVVTRLLELVPAEDVIAITRTPEKLSDFADLGVTVRQGDYDDTDSLEPAFKGVERLLIIPSRALVAERHEQYDNAIRSARYAKVKHLLTYTLEGTTPGNPFALNPANVYAEMALFQSRLPWTIIRTGPYADELVDWLPSIIELGSIPYPTASGKAPYVSRDDIARATAKLLLSDKIAGTIPEFVGPEMLSTEDLCKIAAEVTGEDIIYVPAEPADYVQIRMEEGMSEQDAVVLATMYIAIAEHRMEKAHLGGIEKLTGQAPKSMRELLAEKIASE